MERPRSTISNVTVLVDVITPSISKDTEKVLHIYVSISMSFAVFTSNHLIFSVFSILTLSYFFHITNHIQSMKKCEVHDTYIASPYNLDPTVKTEIPLCRLSKVSPRKKT